MLKQSKIFGRAQTSLMSGSLTNQQVGHRILLYAGRDATEEFNMLHDAKVIPRYAPEAVIGALKK